MFTKTSSNIPESGFKGLIQNWNFDLVAAFSASLVALPLSLGIAFASNAPPIAGIISAIIGGIVTTFFRGSHLGINGPSNGLIAVILIAAYKFNDGTGNTYNYILAAFLFAGLLQIVIGLLKMGRFGEIFPSAVIHGMLAAIGIIILSNQFHVALGQSTDATSSMQVLLAIPESIRNFNPFVTIIAINSLILLIIHPKIRSRTFRFIPAVMWVIIFAVPMVYIFNFHNPHTVEAFKKTYSLGPEFLVSLPENLMEGFLFPNFGIIHKPVFWLMVISIFMVSSIESLVSSKAIDKLDPYNRRTNLSKDLTGVGISTCIAAFIGGIPIVTAIARSSVNVNNGARTRWSNFYHGLILLAIVFFFSPLIQQVPLAALAAILVFTGYKLASPAIWKDTFRKGQEQILIFMVTLGSTLLLGLLFGILTGMVFTALVHFLKSGLPFDIFFNYLKSPSIRVIPEKNGYFYIKIKGIANFLTIMKIKKEIEKIPKGEYVLVDFAHARIVDYGVLEYIHDYAEAYNQSGGEFSLIGLDIHETSSEHPFALHVLVSPKLKKIRLTKRQTQLKQLAADSGWYYQPETDWDISHVKGFSFFDSRPIEFKKNVIAGKYMDVDIKWEICDITFDEGALLAKEVHHTTLQVIKLPFQLPVFTLQKEQFFDRMMELAGHEDIDFEKFRDFSKKLLLKGPEEKNIREFFAPEVIRFFENHEIYHLESNGSGLCVFKHHRLASPKEIEKMIEFSDEMVKLLLKLGIPEDQNPGDNPVQSHPEISRNIENS